MINFKFLLQPHHKYNITQLVEGGGREGGGGRRGEEGGGGGRREEEGEGGGRRGVFGYPRLGYHVALKT